MSAIQHYLQSLDRAIFKSIKLYFMSLLTLTNLYERKIIQIQFN